MHIIVVGAGEVGSYVAERLSRQSHDIVVIERDPERCRSIDSALDVLTVNGNGAHPETLSDAGIDKADLVLAVTSNDEVNLVVSLAAKTYDVAHTIVRIESARLRSKDAQPIRDACGVDLVIDPDDETAQEILDLVQYPGASEVAKMADGEVVVIGAHLPADAPLVGRRLADIAAEFEPEWEFMVGAITRAGKTVIPRSDHRLEADDLLRIAVNKRSRRLVAELMGFTPKAPRRVMLLGGGRTARVVADRLGERGAHVVLVERNPDRARELAETLDRTLVLEGEITDSDLLEEADVGSFDVVVALTGEDDANILACLFAKAAGAGETIAVVHRLALLDLLRDVGIDVALSPRTASANGVLRYVHGDITAVATFLRGDCEVIEITVKPGSPADGAVVQELGLPKGVLIGAIVRDGKSRIARGHSELRSNDHLVVFAMSDAVHGVHDFFG